MGNSKQFIIDIARYLFNLLTSFSSLTVSEVNPMESVIVQNCQKESHFTVQLP